MSLRAQAPRGNIAFSRYLGLVLLVASFLSIGLALWKLQDIRDFIRMWGYQAPARISTIADQTTMTTGGRKLFYVNRPLILSSDVFSRHCPIGAEKTVVLGCYRGNDNGIFLFEVTDERLNGVIEVTAAHEMLHAAYMRLNNNERAEIDALLTDFYNNKLQDTRIKDTIDAYRQTEPSELINEMHSIFGTEIAELPAALEDHYARYFADRQTVVRLLQNYQEEFVGRQRKVDAYDKELKGLKVQIDGGHAALESLRSELERNRTKLDNLRASGQYATYNASVGPYNALIGQYNAQINRTRADIDRYNSIVEARNAVASEQQQLMKSLSSEPVSQSQ